MQQRQAVVQERPVNACGCNLAGQRGRPLGRRGKGKERLREGGASSEALAEPPIFDVGDSDDEEFKHHTSHK